MKFAKSQYADLSSQETRIHFTSSSWPHVPLRLKTQAFIALLWMHLVTHTTPPASVLTFSGWDFQHSINTLVYFSFRDFWFTPKQTFSFCWMWLLTKVCSTFRLDAYGHDSQKWWIDSWKAGVKEASAVDSGTDLWIGDQVTNYSITSLTS